MIPYGAKLYFKDNSNIKEKQVIAEWDPYSMPIIAETEGVVLWKDIIEGKIILID